MKLFESWQLYALGSAFFAALTAIFGKIGVSAINSNLATLIRTVIILLLAVVIVTWNRDWQRVDSLSREGVCFLVLSGIATGLSWFCYYRALQLGPVSRVAPVDKLSVGLVILLGLIFLKESLSVKAALGGVLVLTGVVLMAIP
jgi:transporter family protein